MRFAPGDDVSLFKGNRLTANGTAMPDLKKNLALNLDGDGGSVSHASILTSKGHVFGLRILYSFLSRILRFLLKLGRCGFNASGFNLDRMSKDRLPFWYAFLQSRVA